MSSTTNQANDRQKYSQLLADALGVDLGELDSEALARLDLSALKTVAIAMATDDLLEDGAVSTNADAFPSPIASQRAAELEAEADVDDSHWTDHAGLSPRQQRLAYQQKGKELLTQDETPGPADLASAIQPFIEDAEDVDAEELAAVISERFLTKDELDAQLQRLTEAHREGGVEAVQDVDGVFDELKSAFLDHVADEGGAD